MIFQESQNFFLHNAKSHVVSELLSQEP